MVSFHAATSFLLVLASISFSVAEVENARARAAISEDDSRQHRQLSRPFIANYEPYSQVTDMNAIDLDQLEMEQHLALGSEESYLNAYRIYAEGAYTKMVAEVTLTEPLPEDIRRGTYILGYGKFGNQVPAYAYEDNPRGISGFKIQYQTNDEQNNYVTCQVGASTTPNTKGCLAANGTLTIDGRIEIGYTYDPLVNNVAKRSIRRFSTGAKKEMWQCSSCPYNMYKKFVEYYGYFDYGNQIVMAAFEGRPTNFNNFNNDYGVYGFGGREQIIKKTTAYIIVWMYVLGKLEDALDDCRAACTFEDCNDDSAYSWDVAVAYYTGSLEGDNGAGAGKFAYALADQRCVNFRTCGRDGDKVTGSSQVNILINNNFKKGQGKLTKGECEAAQEEKDLIETLMLVPLVQGTLRYAWMTANEPYSETSEAQGAVYAMAVVPVVHHCDPEAAKIISDNLVVGQAGSADFAAVKKAFESTYECMGIDGCLVGGMYDSAINEYFEGADPLCKTKKEPLLPDGSSAAGRAFGACVVAVAASLVLLLL